MTFFAKRLRRVLKEDASFERHLDLRGWYAKSKVLGEQVVTSQFKSSPINIVVLRAGLVYAPNMKAPLMGCGIIFRGRSINLGMRKKKIPFVHVDDLYSAVNLAMESNAKDKIYNVVSDEQPEVRKILKLYNKFAPAATRVKPFYVPRFLFVGNWLLNMVMPKKNKLGRYNFLLSRTQKNIYYSPEKIITELGWKPKVGFEETMKQMVEYKYKKVNIGVIGCGFAFKTLHLPVILGDPRIKVKAIYDRDEKVAREVKKEFLKSAEILGKIEDFKKNKHELDFVVISTPPDTHLTIAKQLIQEGYNLLIEKPLSLNFKEARQLKELATEHNSKVCVVNNYRFRKNVLGLKSALQSDGSDIRSIAVKFWSGPVITSAGDWRSKLKDALLYEMAYHFIDIAIEIGGKTTSFKYLDTHRDQEGVLTDVKAVLTTKKGAEIHLDLKLHPPYAQTYVETQLKSCSYKAGFYPESLRYLGGSPSPVQDIKHSVKTIISYVLTKKIKKSGNMSHALIYDGFIKSIQDPHASIPVTIKDVLPTMELLEKISREGNS